MKLVSAELTNYCQHRYMSVKFAPGLTAVVGRNGSGKSNLIKAIYAAVTGDFGRNDGVKIDNICQFAKINAPARINVTLEHGDSTFAITRSIRPVSTRLKITAAGAPDLVITKAQESTEAIANILGVSSRMLADYVFVDQWSIFDFLSMMPAERAKAFQRLFRTERAEALWKLLGDHIDSITIPTPGISKDAVIKRLTENREQYEQLSQRLADSTLFLDSYDPTGLRKTIADHQRRQTVESEAKALQQRLAAVGTEVAQLSNRIDGLLPDDTALTEYVECERDGYMQAQQLCASWDTYDAIERNRQQLLIRLAEITSEQDSSQGMPSKPTPYIPQESRVGEDMLVWYVDYEDITQEVYRLKKLIAAINSGILTCDACGSMLTDAAAKLSTFEAQLAAATNKKQVMDIHKQASRAYDRKLIEYSNWKRDIERRRKDTEDQLANMVTFSKPEQSRDALRYVIKKYESMSQARQETHELLAGIRSQHQGKLSVHEQLTDDLAVRIAELAKLPVTDQSAGDAQEQLRCFEKLQTEVATLTVQRQMTGRMVTDDEATLTQLENIEKEAVATRGWTNYCTDIRHLLHRDNLPRLVAHNYLELMQDEINNLLVRFGSIFSVRADASLSFVATFHDGRNVPAGRLSGGEKVLLALAFRVAVNDIFAKDLGLLVLDEPTAGLDEGNLTCLRVAIQRLRELSAARGLQVIMITHERDLHNLFDHVIDMNQLIDTGKANELNTA